MSDDLPVVPANLIPDMGECLLRNGYAEDSTIVAIVRSWPKAMEEIRGLKVQNNAMKTLHVLWEGERNRWLAKENSYYQAKRRAEAKLGTVDSELEMNAILTEENMRLTDAVASLEHRVRGYQMECWEVEQVLGKVLGYPEMFPEVSDTDDGQVCIGEHVPGTIAQEASKAIANLRARIKELEGK